MPMTTEQPPRTVDVGGAGAEGLGLVFGTPPIFLDEESRAQLTELDTGAFCTEYHLSDDIRVLLLEQAYNSILSLFEVDESQLKDLGFDIGHIAELRWALKKMLLEKFPAIKTTNSKGEYITSIGGGHGGAGEGGARRGGAGGIGRGLKIRIQDLSRFDVIGGGHGGAGGHGAAGGASGSVPARDGKGEEPKLAATGTTQRHLPDKIKGLRPALNGGRGGAGGFGIEVGGAGGVDAAPQLSVIRVALFRKIIGGISGAAVIEGGRGGDGEDYIFPTLPTLLCSIDEATRRRIPHTKLEAFEITPDLCQHLKDRGFQTVGGLFETYDTDLPQPQFKSGYIEGLKAALRKFVARAGDRNA